MTATGDPPTPSRNTTNRAGNPPWSGMLASVTTATDALALRRNMEISSAAAVIRGSPPISSPGLASGPTRSAGNRWASLASSIAAAAFPPTGTTSRRRSGRLSAAREKMASALCRSPSASPVGPRPSSPRARARRPVTKRYGRRSGAHVCLKAASASSLSPSTGRKSAHSRAEVRTTGRPARNSLRPRSTAIWPAAPNSADASPTRILPHFIHVALKPNCITASPRHNAPAGILFHSRQSFLQWPCAATPAGNNMPCSEPRR